ncbi:MAG TPA: DMT family transporter [Actinomycetota bacterium]
MRARYRWEFALVGIAAVWGATFPMVQDAVERLPPFAFLAARFALAAAVLAALGAFRGLTARELRAGAVIGGALTAGYAFQTVGLQYTSASNAGFITGMFVVFTPLIGAAVFRALPSRAALTGVTLATAGLVLLAMPAGFRLGKGDALEVATAFAFGLHIVLIALFARGSSALRITGVQVAVTAVATGAVGALAERSAAFDADASVVLTVVVTAIGATVVGFWVQVRAQQDLPPVRTGVILSAEPAFAGLFGYLLAGDRIGGRGIAGAALILVGILVVSALGPDRERL